MNFPKFSGAASLSDSSVSIEDAGQPEWKFLRVAAAPNPIARPPRPGRNQAVKELPQPQLRVAWGFWNTKPCLIRSS